MTADYTVQCRAGDWNGSAAEAVVCIFLYVLGIPGVQWYVLYRNRKCLYERENMSHAEKEKQYKMQKQFGSIYSHYVPECYYYDILDLFRRLLLTGGLIMMGEESVAQVFMGIVICAGWLSLLIHKKPSPPCQRLVGSRLFDPYPRSCPILLSLTCALDDLRLEH